MAAAERIRDLRNAAGRSSKEDEETLGRALVEKVLWGYDSNLTATHMAASTLGMLSPATQFTNINIHRVRLGVVNGVPYLGSLEFLTGQARLAAWPSASGQVDSGQDAGPPPPIDLVIMNPPFTRDSLRYDQFSIAEELDVKEREKDLFGATNAHLAGNSGAFLVLADHICKSDEGAIAAVLPLSGITDKAGFEVRKLLGSRYHVETIVSSHDPERIHFSENTTIGEALIICRQWKGDGPKPPTRVVNLARNPSTPLEALDTAARIDRAGDEAARDFTVQHVDSDRIALGDWSAVNFLSPFLTAAYRALSEGKAPRRSHRSLSMSWRTLARQGKGYATPTPGKRCQQNWAAAPCGITRRTSHNQWRRRPTYTSNPNRQSLTWPKGIGSSAATYCCQPN